MYTGAIPKSSGGGSSSSSFNNRNNGVVILPAPTGAAVSATPNSALNNGSVNGPTTGGSTGTGNGGGGGGVGLGQIHHHHHHSNPGSGIPVAPIMNDYNNRDSPAINSINGMNAINGTPSFMDFNYHVHHQQGQHSQSERRNGGNVGGNVGADGHGNNSSNLGPDFNNESSLWSSIRDNQENVRQVQLLDSIFFNNSNINPTSSPPVVTAAPTIINPHFQPHHRSNSGGGPNNGSNYVTSQTTNQSHHHHHSQQQQQQQQQNIDPSSSSNNTNSNELEEINRKLDILINSQNIWNEGVKNKLNRQTQSIQQLSNCLNQSCGALISLQREVASFNSTANNRNNNSNSSNMVGGGGGGNNSTTTTTANHNTNNNNINRPLQSRRNGGGGFYNGSGHAAEESDDNDDDDDDDSTLIHNNDHHHHHHHHHRHNHTLNNQINPGMRPNNYWDNFRSFSRQNRLSSTSSVSITGGSGGGPMNIAHVQPATNYHLQQQQQQVTPATAIINPYGVGMSMSDHQDLRDSASSTNTQRDDFLHSIHTGNSSPMMISRTPRRKSKINREQNRPEDYSMLAASSSAAPATIFASATNSIQSSGSTSVTPSNNSLNSVPTTVNPLINALTRSIHHQINTLISQHNEHPDQLACLFHDIQNLNINQSRTGGGDISNLSGSGAGIPWPLASSSMRRSFKQRPSAASTEEEDDRRGSGYGDNSFCSRSRTSIKKDKTTSDTGAIESAVPSDYANIQQFHQGSSEGVSGSSNNNDIIKVANVANVAVPKNIQRNLISRERDTRKIRGKDKPSANMILSSNSSSMSNLQSGQPTQSPVIGPDPSSSTNTENSDHFINIQIPLMAEAASLNPPDEISDDSWLAHSNLNLSGSGIRSGGAGGSTSTNNSTIPSVGGVHLNEMAEADQVVETGGATPSSNENESSNNEPFETLDRVPTRLSTDELELRQQQEEDRSLQNLVAEVLDSSSDSDSPI